MVGTSVFNVARGFHVDFYTVYQRGRFQFIVNRLNFKTVLFKFKMFLKTQAPPYTPNIYNNNDIVILQFNQKSGRR